MPLEIKMPKLGLTMTEGQIIEWKKNEGDKVAAGEILYILETEKVQYELESPEDGILGRIIVQQDETVPVGTIVAYLLKPGESMDDIPEVPPPVTEAPAPETAVGESESPVPLTDTSEMSQVAHGGRVRATPLAKKLARELNVDLTGIAGTGSTGRIVADDVKKQSKGAQLYGPVKKMEEKLVPVSGMRSVIARNMMAAKVETAQTYMSVTADASAVVKYRKALLQKIEEAFDVRLSITDLMMKITGAAILKHPIINTRWTDKGIQYLSLVHMGMAMALDNGLIVPVIRDINNKSLGLIARERTELIDKGRENRFLPDDIKGSTFTLSTLGMFGIESFTANINLPESAILAVGAVIDKAVVVDGQIVARPMVNVTLTYDHRIIDGAEAGKFMQTLKNLIEEPISIFV